MIARAIVVLLGLAAAGLAGFGLGLLMSADSWVQPFDVSQEAGA